MVFQKWMPVNNLGNAYDVEDITWGNPVSVTLVADKKRAAENAVHRFRLEWDPSHFIACNITDETYRADCWTLDFEHNGRFYTSKCSDYIEAFKNKSPLFPDDAVHFLIVGTNTVVDVLAKKHPTVRVTDERSGQSR